MSCLIMADRNITLVKQIHRDVYYYAACPISAVGILGNVFIIWTFYREESHPTRFLLMILALGHNVFMIFHHLCHFLDKGEMCYSRDSVISFFTFSTLYFVTITSLFMTLVHYFLLFHFEYVKHLNTRQICVCLILVYVFGSIIEAMPFLVKNKCKVDTITFVVVGEVPPALIQCGLSIAICLKYRTIRRIHSEIQKVLTNNMKTRPKPSSRLTVSGVIDEWPAHKAAGFPASTGHLSVHGNIKRNSSWTHQPWHGPNRSLTLPTTHSSCTTMHSNPLPFYTMQLKVPQHQWSSSRVGLVDSKVYTTTSGSKGHLQPTYVEPKSATPHYYSWASTIHSSRASSGVMEWRYWHPFNIISDNIYKAVIVISFLPVFLYCLSLIIFRVLLEVPPYKHTKQWEQQLGRASAAFTLGVFINHSYQVFLFLILCPSFQKPFTTLISLCHSKVISQIPRCNRKVEGANPSRGAHVTSSCYDNSWTASSTGSESTSESGEDKTSFESSSFSSSIPDGSGHVTT